MLTSAASTTKQVEPPTLASGLWTGLAHAGSTPPTDGASLWPLLAERTDPAQYRPRAIPDVAEEQVREGEQELTVLRSPHGTYLRLTPEQRALWHQMDGTRTVAQLATQAFLQFHQLLPVGELVAALRHEGFLFDQPVGVYRALTKHLEDRTAEGWGRRVLRFFAGRRFQFNAIDRLYGVIYRSVGWLCFTPLFALIWLVIAAVGLAAFALLLLSQRSFASAGGAPIQLVTLWLALLLSFLLHESAHALATKHFGRTLLGGGAMLYFGAPAFYVDTSDIWRSPRRARMLVSAAGPMSDLFVGGLAAGYALLQPEALLAPVAAKLAFTCYIATLFNFNPLLELDGYYVLVDWLRLPDLRRRALEFVRGPLWGKIQRHEAEDERRRRTLPGFRPWSLVFHPFTREEKIFTLYGLLALLYTVVAVVFAVQFWQRWLWGTITSLWAAGGWLNQALAAALVALVVVPVAVGLALAAWGLVKSAVAWLLRNGYGRRPGLVAGASSAAVLAVSLALGSGEGPVLARWVPLALWLVAAATLVAVRPEYRGATVAPALNILLPATALAGVASLARVLQPEAALWQLADGMALLFLLLAAFIAQFDVSLRQLSPRVQLATALLLMLSFSVGGWVVTSEILAAATAALVPSPTLIAQAAPGAILVAAPAFFGVLAVALLLPYLASLASSRLVWSWGLLWVAALVGTTTYVADLNTPSLGLDVLAAGLWAAAWITHLATLRQIDPAELPWKHAAGLSERERLARAFQLCYAGCYRLLYDVYGPQRTRDLDDRMDVIAATANWDVRLDRDNAEIGLRLAALPLATQGARFAEVLRYTVATIEQIAGASFARRVIQAAYDALPWPERETASRLCFPDTPWAQALSHAFGDAQTARVRLLHDVDLLLDCNDDDLATLARSAQTQRVPVGQTILREGELPEGIWIVEAGEVLQTQAGRIVGELHRASAFGAEDDPQASISHGYRASIDTTLLFLPAAELHALTRNTAQPTVSAATLRLLERVPLFAQLPRASLQQLARVATPREFAPREVIIRQGALPATLYVIAQGRAAALTRTPGEKATLRMLARLGPEQVIGEEALEHSPARAHILAETALSTLELPHATIQALIATGQTATTSAATPSHS